MLKEKQFAGLIVHYKISRTNYINITYKYIFINHLAALLELQLLQITMWDSMSKYI